MKKHLVCLLILSLFALFSLPFFAENEDPNSCICGRPYYTEDTHSHEKYECVECGEIISNCTCETCWCGQEIYVNDQDENRCAGCGNICFLCTCADRDVMLKMESDRRNGMLSVADTPKADNAWAGILCFVFITVGLFGYVVRAYNVQHEQAVAQAREEARLQEERRQIMQKIEAEQNGGKTLKQRHDEQVAARQAVRWDAQKTPLGTLVFEMTNAARFVRRSGKYISPSLGYTLDFAQNSDEAVDRAAQGEYGEVVKDAVGVIDFYDNDFYDFIKKEYALLFRDVQENELVHMTNAACTFDLVCGAAKPVVSRFAEDVSASDGTTVKLPEEQPRFVEEKKEGENE